MKGTRFRCVSFGRNLTCSVDKVPASKLSALIETMQTSVSLQIRLLRHVFGILGISQQKADEFVNIS